MGKEEEFKAQLSASLLNAEKKLQALEEEIEKARKVGLDVTHQQIEADSLKRQINKFREVYGV